MTRCTNSFPARKALIYLTLVTAVLALTALSGRAQTRSGADVFQKERHAGERASRRRIFYRFVIKIDNGVDFGVLFRDPRNSCLQDLRPCHFPGAK